MNVSSFKVLSFRLFLFFVVYKSRVNRYFFQFLPRFLIFVSGPVCLTDFLWGPANLYLSFFQKRHRCTKSQWSVDVCHLLKIFQKSLAQTLPYVTSGLIWVQTVRHQYNVTELIGNICLQKRKTQSTKRAKLPSMQRVKPAIPICLLGTCLKLIPEY